jgi:phage FluMu protein gp41
MPDGPRSSPLAGESAVRGIGLDERQPAGLGSHDGLLVSRKVPALNDRDHDILGKEAVALREVMASTNARFMGLPTFLEPFFGQMSKSLG